MEKVIIFGSSGKIGSVFSKIWPDSIKFKFGHDYFEKSLSQKCSKVLQTINCQTYVILCHHNLSNPTAYRELTLSIIYNIPNIPECTIINIASDAELVFIPWRVYYGAIKKQIRDFLEHRSNRVINIFTPYITNSSLTWLQKELLQIHDQGWKYDYYYLSTISQLFKPWKKPQLYVLKNVATKDDYIKFTSEEKIHKFEHAIINDPILYHKMKIILEKHLKVEIVNPSKWFGFVIWLLKFKSPCNEGKLHTDMKRCLFGNMFRCILCVKDTSDYSLMVEGKKYKLHQGDVMILPDGILHKPLEMNHGERIVCIFDFFTSKFISLPHVLLFHLFNNIKALGINV